ncbi:MAG: PilZ domain-containing protein [Thermoanaerobaculia bacterium]
MHRLFAPGLARFARGLARFMRSEDGMFEFECVLPRVYLAAWAPASVGTLCAALVVLAARLRRRHGLPAPPGWRRGADGSRHADPFRGGGPAERRSSVRRGDIHPSVLLSDAEVEARLVRGTVIDRSWTGLAIAVDEPVRPGEVLSVRVAANFQKMPWVQVMVRNSRRERGYFLLGCQFLCPQPWSILMLLG